jgi:hypothetical protein
MLNTSVRSSSKDDGEEHVVKYLNQGGVTTRCWRVICKAMVVPVKRGQYVVIYMIRTLIYKQGSRQRSRRFSSGRSIGSL